MSQERLSALAGRNLRYEEESLAPARQRICRVESSRWRINLAVGWFEGIAASAAQFAKGYSSPKDRMLAPAAMAMNCFPPTAYVIGDALIPSVVGKCQSGFPSRASTATTAPLGSP